MLFFAALPLAAAEPALQPAPPVENETLLSPPAGTPSNLHLSGGADIRARYHYKDNAPNSGGTINTEYMEYYRLRSRVWGEAACGNVTLFSRLANEFRNYQASQSQYAFSDELFVDSLHLDIRNLADERVELRIGRQDLRYGEGRIIRDGSAGDGNRSLYFDALRARFHLSDSSTLDTLGIYQRPEDDWTLGGEHVDLTSLTGGENNELTESAAGFYLTLAENPELPVELYSFWKNESRYFDKGVRSQRMPGRDFNTTGARLMPSLSERLSAELEGAVQFGQTDDGRDIRAFLGYAGILCKMAPDNSRAPTVKLGGLCLSGDENAKTGDDTNWNPVFNRTSWFSELAAGQYSKYYWSNLLYPHAEIAVAPAKAHRISLEAGPMFAEEKDTAQDERYRGLLGLAKYQFPLLSGFFRKESEVTGSIMGQVFDAGPYFAESATGYYLRFELAARL